MKRKMTRTRTKQRKRTKNNYGGTRWLIESNHSAFPSVVKIRTRMRTRMTTRMGTKETSGNFVCTR